MSDGKYKVHLLCRSSARVAPTYFIVRLRTSGLVLRASEAFSLPSPQRDKPMFPAVAQLKQLVPRRITRRSSVSPGLSVSGYPWGSATGGETFSSPSEAQGVYGVGDDERVSFGY